MAMKPKVTAQGVFLGATAALVGAAVEERKQRIIARLTFHNTDAVNRVVEVWLVPLGATVADVRRLERKTLLPRETWSSPNAERQVQDAGAGIYAKADAADKVTVFASEIVVTP